MSKEKKLKYKNFIKKAGITGIAIILIVGILIPAVNSLYKKSWYYRYCNNSYCRYIDTSGQFTNWKKIKYNYRKT